MAEKLLEESESLLIDTPYLRRMRELGREEGIQEGVQIGLEKGVQAVREAILEAVVRKFDPSLADYRQLEKGLARLHQPEALQEILLALFEAADITIVLTLVKQMDRD